MPVWLKSILDWFSSTFGKTMPAPQSDPPLTEVPLTPPLSPLMQRVATIQGVQTVEAYAAKRRFRNCFHEAGHAFVAHACGETVAGIYIDTEDNRPYAAFTKHLSDQLDDQINRGLAGTPRILETLLRVLAIAIAGELQDTEADHERSLTSSRLDAHAWNQHPQNPTADRDRIIVIMRRAGFEGRNHIVQQAEQWAKNCISEGRARYEALVTKLYDDGNLQQPELNNFLNA